MIERKLLRRPQVEDRVGYKKSKIYALIAEGKFPKPVRLGPRSVAWKSDDIDQWIEELPK